MPECSLARSPCKRDEEWLRRVRPDEVWQLKVKMEIDLLYRWGLHCMNHELIKNVAKACGGIDDDCKTLGCVVLDLWAKASISVSSLVLRM